MEEILTVLPFGGTFDLVQIKGSTIKKAFEHAVHRYGTMSGEFLQVSGLSSGTSAPLPTQFNPRCIKIILTVASFDQVWYIKDCLFGK